MIVWPPTDEPVKLTYVWYALMTPTGRKLDSVQVLDGGWAGRMMTNDCDGALKYRWPGYWSEGWKNASGPITVYLHGRVVGELVYEQKQPRSRRPGEPGCPRCADPGDFIRAELVCPLHGVFGGIK